MEVKRFTMPCTRSISCPIVSRRRGFLPENQIMESESYDIDEYEEFNREKINGTFIFQSICFYFFKFAFSFFNSFFVKRNCLVGKTKYCKRFIKDLVR